MVAPSVGANVGTLVDEECTQIKVCISKSPVCTVQVCGDEAKDDCCKSGHGTAFCLGHGICIVKGPHGTKNIVCGPGKPSYTLSLGDHGLSLGGAVALDLPFCTVSGPICMVGGGDEKVVKLLQESPKAWLGVSMVPVPDALEAHIGHGGLMIGNIVEDSPADEAGLQRYDVVVSFDGQAIEEMDDLLKAIADAGEGEAVRMVIVRKGGEKKVTITPGKRPKQGDWEYKYEQPEEKILEDELSFRGHRLRLDPGGNWIFEPLGRLHDLPEPLRGLRLFAPGEDDEDITFHLDVLGDDEEHAEVHEIKILLDADGEKLMIHRAKGGRITVERTDEDGETSSATYDDAEELKEEDPDAYKHLHGVRRGDEHRWIFRYPDLDRLPALQKQYQKQIELKLDRAHEKLREAQEKAGRASDEARKVFEHWVQKESSEAKLDITVKDDGSIKVVIEKDGTRVVYEFDDKDEFKRREPELFEKFRDTLK
jgi:hypothetical protein